MLLTKWSVEDYHQMIEVGILDDRSVELLEGDIVEMSPESPLHTDSGEGLTRYLGRVLDGLAWVREAHPITLENSEPEPDIAIVTLPRSLYREKHPHPQDIYWLIEISGATLSKDLNEKRFIYARAGIQEYWVIAIHLQEVTIFRHPLDSDYQYRETCKTGEINPSVFPQITIDLSKLWRGEIY
jgi:Uma2 family endonuclease